MIEYNNKFGLLFVLDMFPVKYEAGETASVHKRGTGYS